MLRRPHDEGEQRHSQGYCLQKDASKDIELLPNGWARALRVQWRRRSRAVRSTGW